MRIFHHNWFLVAFLAITLLVGFTSRSWKIHQEYPYQFTYRNDVNQYYCYLPALFVYKDLSFKFKNDRLYWLTEDENWIALPKMTMGMSLMYSPFFLIGHGVAMISDYPPDGYSLPYSISIRIGTYIYVSIGLFLLYLSLLRFFKPWVSSLSVFLIFASTNLFYYTMGEGEMSHSYLFFLYSVVIYSTLQWNELKNNYSIILIGLAMGLSVLIRPTSILFAFLPLVHFFYSKENRNWIKKNRGILLFSLISFFAPIFLQMLFWKIHGSGWIRWSYRNEGFFFDNPHFLEFLFGYRNGWLLYTPIMVLALLAVFILPKKMKPMKWAIFFIVPSAVYILSSWWCWWFGGSYGSRPMIEFYALLIFPLAAGIQFFSSKKMIKVLMVFLFFSTCFYNILGMHKKTNHELHWDSMSKESFWYTFSKMKLTGEERQHLEKLYKQPDYDNARKGLIERKMD